MKLATLIFILLSFSLEAKILLQKKTLHISEVSFDYTWLKKELKSGLPLIMNLLVRYKSQKIKEERVLYIIKSQYDLWEEHYTYELIAPFEHQTFHFSLDEIIKHYEIIKLPFQDFSGEVDVKIVINPVKREKVKLLKSWLAQNSVTHSSIDPGEVGAKATGPRFKKLFNKLVEQYIDDQAMIGAYQYELSSNLGDK